MKKTLKTLLVQSTRSKLSMTEDPCNWTLFECEIIDMLSVYCLPYTAHPYFNGNISNKNLTIFISLRITFFGSE